MNLDTKVRVISDTTTFYPLERDDDEPHSKNDNLSLRTTLVYLHEQMGEDFKFFTADDLFVVLQQWRGMLFFIQTNDSRFHEVMRLQLQTIREILIFLFGPKFESVMKRSISMDKRKVFAQYVDSYLSLCQEDYLYLLNIIRTDPFKQEMSQYFIQTVSTLISEFDIHMLNVTLFDGNQIVARFDSPGSAKLDAETLLNLSILEKVEYNDISIDDGQIPPFENVQTNLQNFDPAFIEDPNNNTFKHKNAFLRIQRSPVCCLLSSSRLGAKSPYVILLATQNMKITEEMRVLIMKFISTITLKMSQFISPPPEEKSIEVMDDLIHYVLIDRTHGKIWELPLDLSVGLLVDYMIQLKHNRNRNNDEQDNSNEDDEDGDVVDDIDDIEACKMMHELTMKMSAYGMSAMMQGLTTMFRGEQDYQFCYELRFQDEKGETLKPNHVFTPPSFNDDNGVNYTLITSSLFPNTENVTCLELLSIYRGGAQVKDVMRGNDALFDFYKGQK